MEEVEEGMAENSDRRATEVQPGGKESISHDLFQSRSSFGVAS